MKMWSAVFGTLFRVLTFRARREELIAMNWRHLTVGLFFTWLAGMGRYWDNPRAEQLQVYGFGSVIYVFALSALVYVVVWALRPRDWHYSNLLTFVTLTSPPAILYAIPVEMFMSRGAATSVNSWFLAIVAAWRLALLVTYLKRVPALKGVDLVTGSLLPVVLVIVSLTMLNLQHAVFDIMRGTEATPEDAAYMVLLLLTCLSMVLVWPLLLAYFFRVAELWPPKDGKDPQEISPDDSDLP